MTGEEFLELASHTSSVSSPLSSETSSKEKPKQYVYGLRGLASLFGCSIPTANRIKQSKQIDGAIRQIGRKIIIDADLALELAGRKKGGRR